MKTPILETDRLTLRPLKLDDAEQVYMNWSSDPENV
jgi:ribosomal-protein-alanine N-acetyltransferase